MANPLWLSLLLVASGCAATAETPILAGVPESPPSLAGEPAPSLVGLGPSSPGSAVPTLIFDHSRGAEPARVAAGFAQVRPILRECASSGGVIRLAVQSTEGRTQFVVQADTGLDPRQRRCVLEALSTVDVDGILAGSGPRPGGFTALIRIDW